MPITAFFSFTLDDDIDSDGRIIEFGRLLERDIQSLTGNDDFSIFIEHTDHRWGQRLDHVIQGGLEDSAFLIPVISPRYLGRTESRNEFLQFRDKERRVYGGKFSGGTDGLILPLLYLDPPAELEDDVTNEARRRQWVDVRHLSLRGTKLKSKTTGKIIRVIAERLVDLIHNVSSLHKEFYATSSRLNPKLESIVKAFGRATEPLLAWPSTMPNGAWLDRVELGDLLERCVKTPASAHVVIGPPGAGKSSLLTQLAQKCRDNQTVVLGIKADFLPVSVSSVENLSRYVLGGEGDLVEEILCLAESRPICVIIDQLDAVADLVDLTSGRLDILLTLIHSLRGKNNVHLICSSRTYELRHDLRLNALATEGDRTCMEIIELKPLNREQIRNQLASAHIDGNQWPERYFDFLSIPYHLRVFLENVASDPVVHTDVPERDLFDTIHTIHEIHWRRTVASNDNSSERIRLLSELTKLISETEEFRQPASLFDAFGTAVFDLERAGWINSHGFSVGFAHQTQYEFVSARRFASNPNDFIQHVLARENGLFVRPCVWHTLNYTRSANPYGYELMMEGLLHSVTRRHLRMLLIDFLGQINDPRPNEVAWVTELLNERSTYALMSYRLWRQEGWYNALYTHVLPALMGQTAASCWPVAHILEYAWPFAADRNRALLREHWSYREERALLFWSVVSDSPSFDEELINWLCWIASSVDITQWALTHTSQNVAKTAPESAPRILAAGLNRRLDAILLERAVVSLPTCDDDDDDKIQDFVEKELNQTLAVTWEVENRHWHGVDKMAETVPEAFLKEIWPWFQRAIENCEVFGGSLLDTFTHERGYDHWFEGELAPNYPLPWAIQIAVQQLAKTQPKAFGDFFERNKTSNSMSIQYIFASGLSECASTLSNLAFHFLETDDRRFFLGTFQNGMSAAMKLVHRSSPHWTQEQITAFQWKVINWKPSGQNDGEHDDTFRARLLASIPPSGRIPEAIAIISTNQISEADIQRPRLLSVVKSPINAIEMQKISDAEILALFSRLVDGTGRNDPDDRQLGGSEQVSHEFKEFAKLEPERAAKIIGEFHPNTQERPAGYGLIGLADVNFNPTIICDLVRELDKKGFVKPEFRDDVGRALQDVAIAHHGLPEDLCSALRKWLLEDPLPELQSEIMPSSTQEAQRSDSILWSHLGMICLPNRWYWIGVALKLGLCLSEPARKEEWLNVLSECAARPFPKDVWVAWLLDFTEHFLPDRRAAAQIIGTLLSSRMDILASEMGLRACAHFSNWLDEKTRHELLARLCDTGWNRSQLAKAEIVALWALRDDDQECWTLIDQWIPTPPGDSDYEIHCLGLANTAAHMWSEASWRAKAVSILCKLISSDSLRIRKAILNAFRQEGCLRTDAATRDFLGALGTNFNFDSIDNYYGMSRQLVDFLPHEPKLILRICQRVVTSAKRSANNNEARFSSSIPHLIAIALTLHRSSDTTIRTEALTLFEDLLEQEAYGASQALTELDQRPIPTKKLNLE